MNLPDRFPIKRLISIFKYHKETSPTTGVGDDSVGKVFATQAGSPVFRPPRGEPDAATHCGPRAGKADCQILGAADPQAKLWLQV